MINSAISSRSSLSDYMASRALMNRSTTTSSTSSRVSPSALLQTANTAVYEMASLASSVKALSHHARLLNEKDTAGIDAMRTQVANALTKFNDIANSANIEPSKSLTKSAVSNTAPTDAKPPTLQELRSTLDDMQVNLRSNMRKVGGGILTALTYSNQRNSQ